MKLRYLFTAALFALFAAVQSVAAPISAATKASIAAQIQAAGNNPAKLAAAAKAIVASLPASQRAAAGAAIMQSLTAEAAKNSEAVTAVVSAAVGEGKQQAANAGAGNAGQTAAATAIANAMLANAGAGVFANAKTAAVSAGAFEASLPQAPGDLGGSGDQGVTTAGQNTPPVDPSARNVSGS